MLKMATALMSATALFAMAACSQETQDNIEQTAESAGEDIEANVEIAGEKIEEGADELAGEAAQALDDAGNAIEDRAAEEDKQDATEDSDADAKTE